jgi:hypothetical protein
VIVIDNFLPTSLEKLVEKTLLGPNFDWYFVSNVTYNGKDGSPAFSHQYKAVNNYTSRMLDLVSPIAHLGAAKAEFECTEIIQARSFLQLPLAKNALTSKVDPLHIDLCMPHMVVLYYVRDSDGDTLIVDKKFDIAKGEEKECKYTDYKLLARVTPKKGRAVIFDGAYYHTAEQPKSNIRCVINFNIEKEIK